MRINGWIIKRDPVIVRGAANFVAFGHGFHIGFDRQREAKAFCLTHPPTVKPRRTDTCWYTPGSTIKCISD